MSSIENTRILLVEDHRDLAETVIDFLDSMGAVVDYAADGMTGLHLATKQRFDVIVLDVMLPGLDGISLCKQLRQTHDADVPVIMMTARDELNDKLAGFESGADDYLVKPFDLPELVARIASLVRRERGRVAPRQLQIEDLTIDTGSLTVVRDGQAISLSPACFQILHLLMQRAPNVVSREDIENALWGDEPPTSDTLRSQIYKLRQAVDKPFSRALVQTVQGTGYRIGLH